MNRPVSALSLRGVEKRFGSTRALAGASLDVRTGTLHALLGENGAGKTTLMRLAFGMSRMDAGAILVGGIPQIWRSSRDAIAAGIGMVHQHFLLVPALTVTENIALGDRSFFGGLRGFDLYAAGARIRRTSEESGLVLDPSARVADLPVGAQQRLEIVKALTRNAKLLILDEPTAVLSPQEAQELYAWLRRFVTRGRTVVLITHKVAEALAVADDVTVLREGRTVLSGPTVGLATADVVAALLGERVAEAPDRIPQTRDRSGTIIMHLEHVSVTDARGVVLLRDATCDVHAGEIVGVAGVEGAGQHELLRVLAGRLQPTSGAIHLPARIGFVPEDRLRDALVPSMSLAENLALAGAGNRRGVMRWSEIRQRTKSVIRAHDVRTQNVGARVDTLSGGNQQKLVLARELDCAPAALIAENPTRGLDIRATRQVLDRLREARTAGLPIVVYSSDLDEVLSIADRMLVCFGGRVSGAPCDPTVVGRMMVGLA